MWATVLSAIALSATAAWACRPAVPPPSAVEGPPGPIRCDAEGCTVGEVVVPWFVWEDACTLRAALARDPLLGAQTPGRQTSVALAGAVGPLDVTLPPGWKRRAGVDEHEIRALRPGAEAAHGGPVLLGGGSTRDGAVLRGGWEASWPPPVVYGVWLDTDARVALTAELASRSPLSLPVGAGLGLGPVWDVRAGAPGARGFATLTLGPVRAVLGPEAVFGRDGVAAAFVALAGASI